MAEIPSYRKRPDRDQALVTLTDAATGKRRDYWLGPCGSPASREIYHRLIAEWESRDRRLPNRSSAPADESPVSGPAIKELIAEYWPWARSYYHRTRAGAIKRPATAAPPLRAYASRGLRSEQASPAAGGDDPTTPAPIRRGRRGRGSTSTHRCSASATCSNGRRPASWFPCRFTSRSARWSRSDAGDPPPASARACFRWTLAYRPRPGERAGLNWRVPSVTGQRTIRHVVFDTNYWKSFIRARLASPWATPAACRSSAARPYATACWPSI